MIFDNTQERFLKDKMCINPNEFSDYMINRFGSEIAKEMNDVIHFLSKDEEAVLLSDVVIEKTPLIIKPFWNRFEAFLNKLGFNEGDFFDYCYELFNYFCAYYTGGIWELFKKRNPEWLGPRIYLTNRICNEMDLINLPSKISAYRGMSKNEYNSSSYGMSWSLNVEEASRFALIQNGLGIDTVIVNAVIEKGDVLNYEPNDSEEEIVVANGTVTSGVLV